jgi:uncharacterized membrane protein YraQ (UPF0718 family)
MDNVIPFIMAVFTESWALLLEASVYILFGLLVGGLLKVFLSPAYVARHLGKGRFSSVFKAALFGIPIPLCSCAVLPAAASLKKQALLLLLLVPDRAFCFYHHLIGTHLPNRGLLKEILEK